MGRDTVQLGTAVSTITQEYLLEFTSEYGISEDLHPELLDRGDRIVDFPEGKIHLSQLSVIDAAKVSHFEIQCSVLRPLDSLKNWNNRFFWVDERVFPIAVAWRTSAPKDSMPLEGMYSVEDVAILNTRRTPIQKTTRNPVMLKMDLFNLISAPNPAVIKTGTRPRTAHEVPLLTVIASRQIDMDEPAATSESSGAPSTIERSPLDFSNENPSEQINEGDGAEDQGPETMASVVPPAGPSSTMGAAPNIVEEEETAADAPLVSKRRRKRANEESNANAPRKVLRKDFDASHPTQSTVGGKSLASIRLGASSTVSAPASQETPAGRPTSPTMVVSPGSIYQPEWGVTNGYRLDTPSSCQELVDHLLASGDGISAAVTAMEGEKKNLETLLEAEADIRKAVEAKNAELVKEMESLHAQFTELQYKDERVSAQCAEMDSRLDAFSIDFDEELYLHMLTVIVGRRWVIGHDLRLAMLKCAESLELKQTFANVVSIGITKGFCDGLKYRVEQGEAKLDLAMVEGYDPEAEANL
ncbi:hypothetical protein Tco_0835964 [Tanacetum coccineum]